MIFVSTLIADVTPSDQHTYLLPFYRLINFYIFLTNFYIFQFISTFFYFLSQFQ